MKPITKWTPITLISLLGGGMVLIRLGTILPYALAPWLLIAIILLFVSGLLLGLIDFFRSIAILRNAESRNRTGLMPPLLTAFIATAAWSIFVAIIAFLISGIYRPCPFAEHFPEMPPDAQILDSWCIPKNGMDHTCIYKVRMNDHEAIAALLITNGFLRVRASEADGLVTEYPDWWPSYGDYRMADIFLHRERDSESGYPYLNRIVRYDPESNLYYFQWYDL